MLETTRTPLPPSGRVSVRTAVLPSGARLSTTSLDELAQGFQERTTERNREEGRGEARQEALASASAALEAAAERIDQARERAEEAVASDAVQLGVEIARQILKIEIDAGNYGLEQIVRSTLAASEIKRGQCVVHLNPQDVEMLSEVVFRDGTALAADPEIARGSVHVETPRGLLVREPSAAMEEIREQLLEDLA